MIKNLLDLEVNKVSRNINDYSLMITAKTGFGKTPLIAELYGDRAIFLAFEKSTKGIAGVHTVDIDSYQTLLAYVGQLENPLVREKFDVVVIDTLSLLDYLCEKSVTDSYGKDLIRDCLVYNQAYKIVDKRFLEVLKRLQRMNYTMCYICHPTEKKVKISATEEIIRFEPKVSDRIINWIIPEVDIRVYCDFDENGNKVIYTKTTPYFDARVRGSEMPYAIPFSANVLRQEFALGVDRFIEAKDLITDSIENKNVASAKDRSLEVVLNEVMELGKILTDKGLNKEANAILTKNLGCDDEGKQRTLNDVNPRMIPALEAIIIELKNLNQN